MKHDKFICALFRSTTFPKGIHVRLKSDPTKTGFAIAPKINKVKTWFNGIESEKNIEELEIE